MASCLVHLQPAFVRGGGELLERLDARVFPLVLERIPQSAALPGVVALWKKWVKAVPSERMFSLDRSAQVRLFAHYYRGSVCPRVRVALFELLFYCTTEELACQGSTRGEGALTFEMADQAAALRILQTMGLDHDLARRPRSFMRVTQDAHNGTTDVWLPDGHDDCTEVVTRCAQSVCLHWRRAFVAPLVDSGESASGGSGQWQVHV